MSKVVSMQDAVREIVRDGDTVAIEGFTHLICHAAGHEIIRQRKKNLTLARMTPDVVYDQMIGAGVARRLIFSWLGNPGVGSLHGIRRAIEKGHPVPLSIEEYSHFGMVCRYTAGAANLPFMPLRSYEESDIPKVNDNIRWVEDPYGSGTIATVPALNPDVGIIHAQQADRHGNVMLWGITGVQKECVLASRRAIVTVEEVVDSFAPRVNGVVLPGWVVDAVVVVPGGAHPSYASGYSERDNPWYARWDEISRDRESFADWLVEIGAAVGVPR